MMTGYYVRPKINFKPIYVDSIVVIIKYTVCWFIATGNNSYLLPIHRKCKGPPTVHRSNL